MRSIKGNHIPVVYIKLKMFDGRYLSLDIKVYVCYALRKKAYKIYKVLY
jgi:hypothetical protein